MHPAGIVISLNGCQGEDDHPWPRIIALAASIIMFHSFGHTYNRQNGIMFITVCRQHGIMVITVYRYSVLCL